MPFSNIAARLTRGVDLRHLGNGTVSGTALFEVSGFGPLAAAGVLEVAKGAVGPLLAGRTHRGLAAIAAGAAVTGHDWSPLLGWAGGRGLSPAIGALAVTAPAGAVTLLTAMVAGRLLGHTALAVLCADALLVPVVLRAHGRAAAWSSVAVVVPMIAKRLSGNGRRAGQGGPDYLGRFLFDRDRHDSSRGNGHRAAAGARWA